MKQLFKVIVLIKPEMDTAVFRIRAMNAFHHFATGVGKCLATNVEFQFLAKCPVW